MTNDEVHGEESNAARLPTPRFSVNMSELFPDRAEDMADREGFTSVCFTSIPERGFEQIKDIAKQRGVFPRDVYCDAIRCLLDRRKKGEIKYHASKRGGVKRTIWLENDLLAEMNAAAEHDSVNKTAFFLTALNLYAEHEGLDVEI